MQKEELTACLECAHSIKKKVRETFGYAGGYSESRLKRWFCEVKKEVTSFDCLTGKRVYGNRKECTRKINDGDCVEFEVKNK